MKDRQKELIDLLNAAWDLIPDKPTYGQFNLKIPVLNNKEKLRKLEEENSKLGISSYDTPLEGLSISSILATITDILCDSRLYTIVENTPETLRGKYYSEMNEDQIKIIHSLKVIGFEFDEYKK